MGYPKAALVLKIRPKAVIPSSVVSFHARFIWKTNKGRIISVYIYFHIFVHTLFPSMYCDCATALPVECHVSLHFSVKSDRAGYVLMCGRRWWNCLKKYGFLPILFGNVEKVLTRFFHQVTVTPRPTQKIPNLKGCLKFKCTWATPPNRDYCQNKLNSSICLCLECSFFEFQLHVQRLWAI